jgi:threonine dehydrogenase-like Zn-dependent dehydrogenase
MTLVAPQVLELQQRQLREIAEGHARIHVCYAGICGTDLALYRGQYKTNLPLVLGHEFVGVVEQVAPDVSSRWKGKRVVSEINNHCRAYRRKDLCPECLSDQVNHCRKRTVIGIAGADGAFAEYIDVPVGNMHFVSDALDDYTATLIEPMAAALQTFNVCPIEPGQRVLVMGAGRLGLLIIAAARSANAEVIAVSRSQERLDFAKQFGAEHLFTPSGDLPDQIKAIYNNQLADIVVEATGNTNGIREALALVRPRGTICVKTTMGEPSLLDLTKIVVDEIQLSASRCGAFAPAIHFLEQHKLPLKQWFHPALPLSQLSHAMQLATKPGKVLLDIRNTKIYQ